MLHIALALQLTVHLEQSRFQQRRTLLDGDAVPDDQIDVAGFIFHGYEGHIAGAAWPLPGDDHPRRAHQFAVGMLPQLLRWNDAALLEPVAQERERMTSQSQPRTPVVGEYVLPLAWCTQQGNAFIDGG